MTLFYLLTVVICSAYVLLIVFYLLGWIKTKVWLYKPRTRNPQLGTRVSVIIPARNEEHNILNCLSSIYKQTYPLKDFEVIVVDDHSSDRTQELVRSLYHPNLKLIHLSQTQMGKKQAITEGIKNAVGNLIITTDADCEMGKEWLAAIVSFYEEKPFGPDSYRDAQGVRPKMIVGPVLLKGENSVQKIVQSQEMTVLTACAGASVYYDLPILCSGANLAFEKSAFLAVNGFDGVDKTATGDDMFLMLKVHKKFPKAVSYLKSKEAVVYTLPVRSSSEVITQRKRWASKGFSYGFSYVTGIAVLVFFTNFLILFSGIMSAINLKFAPVAAICFSAKFLVDFMLLYSVSSFFSKRIYPLIFVIASAFYPLYVSVIGLISPFTNYSWKSRRS